MSDSASAVAVATTSEIAADAAAEIADLGGNAVDCGIAAALCSINTQPGVCALAGSAFVTIWAPGQAPVTIDGNVAIPGIGRQSPQEPVVDSVELEYGGGVETLIGVASVAVPGTLAALHIAAERYGRVSWRDLLMPSIRAAREGFPLAAACHHYLTYSGNPIYGRSQDGHSALHHDDGSLRGAGTKIFVPHLASTLEVLATEGPAVFYEGELGRTIVSHVQDGGGTLTLDDLRCYAPEVREALLVDAGDWTIASNPPPAIGGASLVAMLRTFGTDKFDGWTDEAIARLIRTQEAVLSYRKSRLDPAEDLTEPVAELLDEAQSGELLSRWASASTVHTSAVDNSQLACSVTASAGYGSGEMPQGTGLWLNNCLGELELNHSGLSASPPGRRLPSNMAPSIARSANTVVAFGSPGADRITTALHQFLINFAQIGLELDAAVEHPRLHVSVDTGRTTIAIEPGLQIPKMGPQFAVARYTDKNMYFGGVAAALCNQHGEFRVAADPRREGGIFTG